MSVVKIFDPAMCCSTGVCGPSVDPKLARFAADLDWLKRQGIAVERFNLSQQPGAFAADSDVKSALETLKAEALPLIKVDGMVKSTGRYPTREELAEWVVIDAPEPSIYSDAVAELVAIGAAIASNCESCFKFHFDKARKLSVSNEDMLRAVKTAQAVKDSPAKSILILAEKLLDAKAESQPHSPKFTPIQQGGCCGSDESGNGSTQKSGCC